METFSLVSLLLFGTWSQGVIWQHRSNHVTICSFSLRVKSKFLLWALGSSGTPALPLPSSIALCSHHPLLSPCFLHPRFSRCFLDAPGPCPLQAFGFLWAPLSRSAHTSSPHLLSPVQTSASLNTLKKAEASSLYVSFSLYALLLFFLAWLITLHLINAFWSDSFLSAHCSVNTVTAGTGLCLLPYLILPWWQ